MIDEAERELAQELAAWAADGRTPRFWLRDDDAVAATPALDRLLGLIARHDAPLLIAVIPLQLTDSLAPALAQAPLVEAAVHGVAHENHAPPGRRAEETPPERGIEEIGRALAQARSCIVAALGAPAGDIYVPPWNRLPRETAALLPGLGFRAVSAWTGGRFDIPGLAELPTHLDLIAWRRGRVGKPAAAILADATRLLAARRVEGSREPIGVLGHHLVHDATAWEALTRLLGVTRAGGARWVSARALLAEAAT